MTLREVGFGEFYWLDSVGNILGSVAGKTETGSGINKTS